MLQKRAFILKGARLFAGIVKQGGLMQQRTLTHQEEICQVALKHQCGLKCIIS